MTTRTKHRLAVLAFALGLIAAAPYLFFYVCNRARGVRLPVRGLIIFASVAAEEESGKSWIEIYGGPYHAAFVSGPHESLLVWDNVLARPPHVQLFLPSESITLRIACAVALGAIWFLVLGGRWLARRCTRKNPSSVAV